MMPALLYRIWTNVVTLVLDEDCQSVATFFPGFRRVWGPTTPEFQGLPRIGVLYRDRWKRHVSEKPNQWLIDLKPMKKVREEQAERGRFQADKYRLALGGRTNMCQRALKTDPPHKGQEPG